MYSVNTSSQKLFLGVGVHTLLMVGQSKRLPRSTCLCRVISSMGLSLDKTYWISALQVEQMIRWQPLVGLSPQRGESPPCIPTRSGSGIGVRQQII